MLLKAVHFQGINLRVPGRQSARIGYFFNPKSNFNAYLGWMYRTENRGTIDDRFNMFKFGIEMSLMNTYEDF